MSEIISPLSKFPLDPDQDDVRRMILNYYADRSGRFNVQLLPADTGWGKTRTAGHVAYYLALEEGMLPLVVCPKTLMPQWRDFFAALGIPLVGLISSNGTLAGSAPHGVSHPFLVRGQAKDSFQVTKFFQQQCAPVEHGVERYYELEGRRIRHRGLFLIFDEMHYMKNDSARHYAAFEMIRRGLTMRGSLCRVLHLSAAPMAKASCWPQMFRLMGLCFTKQRMYTPDGKHPGLADVKKIGQVYDAHVTRLLTNSVPIINKKASESFLEQMWVQVYKQDFVLDVSDLVTGFERYRFNSFYTLDEDDIALAEEGLSILKRVFVKRKADGRIVNDQDAIRKLTKGMMLMTKAKVPVLTRITIQELTENPNMKGGPLPSLQGVASNLEAQARILFAVAP